MFGTVSTTDGSAYFEEKNSLLVDSPLFATTVAPFGRPQIQQIHTHEYAKIDPAIRFCAVLHGRLIEANDPNFDGAETATFTVPYPKYIILCGTKRVNAGTIASIIGDDTVYGTTPAAKAGHLADELGEKYDKDIHVPLMEALIAAALASV